MKVGEPQVSLEPAGNHPSPPPFCRDGFMTTSELLPWNSRPILTQSPFRGCFATQRHRSDQSPTPAWSSFPADAGTKAISKFIRRTHDPTG